jgi:hypothetical protein
VVAAACVLEVTAYSQYGRTPRSERMPSGSRGQSRANSPTPDEPLVTFRGTLRSITAKKLVLDSEESNEVEFRVSKKTSALDGDKKLKPADLAADARVEVEARRALNGTLEAVIVHVVHPEAEKKKDE